MAVDVGPSPAERLPELAALPAQARRRHRQLPSAGVIAAAVALAIIILAALIVPALGVSDPISLEQRLAKPTTAHGITYLLGGDPLGRSVLVEIVLSARVSLLVGFGAALLAAVVGTPLGIIAALSGPIVRDAIMRVVDLWMSLPGLLIALVVLYTAGAGVFKIVLVLGLLRWVVFARLGYTQTQSILGERYAEAARAMGCNRSRLITRHVIPNMAAVVVGVTGLEVARAMLSEAGLTYLGLGVQPPASTWGTMLSAAQNYLSVDPWVMVFPGAAILLTTLSINVIANHWRGTTRV